jgi:arginyl-tRNA synthetase
MEGSKSPHYSLNSFRSAIVAQVAQSLGVSNESAYEAVNFGKNGSDFTVAVPRFRLKESPQKLVQKLVSKVRKISYFNYFITVNCQFSTLLQFQPTEHVEFIRGDGVFVHFQCHTANLIRTSLSEIHKLSQPTPTHPHGSYGPTHWAQVVQY